MAATSELFSYAYALSYNNGTYAVLDADRHLSGVQPIADGVTLSDSNGGSLVVGDAVTAHLAAGEMSPLPGYGYTYIGEATAEGNSGFIVQDVQGANFFVTNSAFSGSLAANNGGALTVAFGGGPGAALCFMAGTGIATPDGTSAVEDLAIGQLVTTHDGTAAPVRWIGRQTVARRFARDRLPIRIKAGALAEQLPSRDLLVSPAHALLVDGVLAQAGALVNGVSILRESEVPSSFVYYHVELDDHALILAENVPAETFVDNVERTVFDNWDEYLALYPDGRNVAEMEFPRAKSHRQVPKALREKLAARGEALFGARVETAA